MTKMKSGDIITVQAETAKTSYQKNRNFDILKVETKEDIEEFSSIKNIFKRQIFKIVRFDSHPDMVEAGGNVCYYALQGEKIESLVPLDDGEGEGIRVNGEHDIYFNKTNVGLIANKYFFSEENAQLIATSLNVVELERAKVLQKAVDKSVVLLQQIVDKNRV